MSNSLTASSIERYLAQSERTSGGSNFLSMCEMAVKVSHASVQCRACCGTGFQELSELEVAKRQARIDREDNPKQRAELREILNRETDCLVCHGSGYTTQKRADRAAAMDSMFTTVRCSKCRGCGENVTPDDESAEVGDVCLACGVVRGALDSKANGFFVPVTVKEKGSSKNGKAPPRTPDGDDDGGTAATVSSWVDEDAVVERGRTGRQLDALRQTNPEIGAAVESYFGADGGKWAPHKWTRTFALWQHTPSGCRLAQDSAERSKLGHGYLLAPLDLIAAERDAEERATESSPRRRALIMRADAEARDLCRRMHALLRSSEAA